LFFVDEGSHVKRREFITLVGGAALAGPLAARAQQERARRIGVLVAKAADDPEAQFRPLANIRAGLEQLGWTAGRNLEIDYREHAGTAESGRQHADELVALAPDVLVCSGTASADALLRATHTVPIVFVNVVDPVGAGYVESLGRPGGNATGFMTFEYSVSAKWAELLKQIAPAVTRAVVLRDPASTAGVGQFAVIQSIAPSVGIDVSPLDVRDASAIERAVTAFARSPNAGMIVTASGLARVHSQLITAVAARNKIPAVYYRRHYVTEGGLLSYGPDFVDQYRRAPRYVDRILKGEKAADLPVQVPTKYELVINLKTAKALGLTIPPTLLARADEIIE